MKFTFDTLQEEQADWALKNFGAHEPWRPLMGMCEELRELVQALRDEDDAGTLDSVADTVIFSSDFCTCMGWSLSDVVDSLSDGVDLVEYSYPDEVNIPILGGSLLSRIGKIQHHYLKHIQAICTNEDYLEGIWVNLVGIFSCLSALSEKHYNKTLLEVTGPVWSIVRQRDWTKNKVDATSPAA